MAVRFAVAHLEADSGLASAALLVAAVLFVVCSLEVQAMLEAGMRRPSAMAV